MKSDNLVWQLRQFRQLLGSSRAQGEHAHRLWEFILSCRVDIPGPAHPQVRPSFSQNYENSLFEGKYFCYFLPGCVNNPAVLRGFGFRMCPARHRPPPPGPSFGRGVLRTRIRARPQGTIRNPRVPVCLPSLQGEGGVKCQAKQAQQRDP